MKYCYTLLLFLAFLRTSNAQLIENFDDGDFNNNPTWFGDTDIFIVNPALELQLMDVAGGTANLYLPAPTANATTWEILARQEFAPSTSNVSRIYLRSDNNDLGESLNGYYLRIGGESGTTDALELYRQDGNSSTLLIRGTEGALGNDPSQARIRVSVDDQGLWLLEADYAGGTNYTNEGSETDLTHTSGDFFGLYLTYTSTRADKFFFDDLLIDPLFVDMTPPNLSGFEVLSATSVDLSFNEALDPSTANLASNYSIDNGAGISNAQLDGNDPQLVHLTIDPALLNGNDYMISVSEVSDLAGNGIPPASPESINFTFVEFGTPGDLDILIHEFLPDPTPAIGLPEFEFIELYNPGSLAYNLANFEISRENLSSGTMAQSTLPGGTLNPGDYVILCRNSDVSFFEAFTTADRIIGLSSFSGFLPNSDDALLELRDGSGNLIHQVIYSTDMYQGADPNGRSIEMINPAAACLGNLNFGPSTSGIGGTIAAANSNFDPNFGQQSIALLAVEAIDALSISATLNKSILENSAETPTNYSLSGPSGNLEIASVIYDDADQSLSINLSDALISGQTYTLELQAGLTDCLGNTPNGQIALSFDYLETQLPEVYDLIITEIYADPSPSLGLPEFEFIELFNRSEKNIQLDGLMLMDRTSATFLPGKIMKPGDYLILVELGNTGYSVFGDTLGVEDFPSLGNENDDLELLDANGNLIHAVYYDRSWYQNTNRDDGGYTLELVNPNEICLQSENWRASNELIGGTPGQQNSLFDDAPDSSTPALLRAFPVNSNNVRLTFSEALDPTFALELTNYSVDQGIGSPLLAQLEAPLFNSVVISLPADLQAGTVYTVTIQSPTDCNGNAASESVSVQVGLSERPEPGDLILNEVLFNPVTGGVDFVELYNLSSKIINANDLILGNRDDDGLVGAQDPVEEDFLILPGTYVVFTEDPILLQSQYNSPNPEVFISTDLPTYGDNDGVVLILSPGLISNIILEEFAYEDDYHVALLDDDDGVSLERTELGGNTQDPELWHSAAESVGFATPGYENSQRFELQAAIDDFFVLESQTVSPDGDGFRDFLLIGYQTDQPGFIANMTIFDA
ncbi:MAG: lamin tail domain-containing protein, partial [Bacteroidota bacterium]